MKSREVPAVFRRKSERISGNNVTKKPISSTLLLYQYYLDETNRPVPEQARENHESGRDVSPADLNEFHNFHTFISSHVQPAEMCDTPCMLLWAEWVRFCLKEMHTFPRLILEKEFRDLAVNQFGFTVFDDEVRGRVYPGVRFVWRKNISQNVIDRESAMV